MRKRGVFITLEGTDGVGKTTQTHLLCRWLKDRGHDVVQTREPGGGAAAHVAERIREILLDPVARMAGMTELFLYEAARAEHVEKVIRPALEAGKTVVCDRYIDSTTAYQGQARSLPMKAINTLNAIATQGIKPDLTILLNLPARVGLQKALARAGNGGDRLEQEGHAFQRLVQRGFLAAARREPRRIKVVNVQATIEGTHGLIRKILEKHGYHRP